MCVTCKGYLPPVIFLSVLSVSNPMTTHIFLCQYKDTIETIYSLIPLT